MRHFLILLLGLLTCAVAGAHETHGQPQHGGIVAEAGMFQGELVVAGTQLTLYLSEHGKALSTKGANARLTLLASGRSSDVLPSGSTAESIKFTLPAPAAAGSKLVISVKLADGRSGSLRFVLTADRDLR